MNNEYENYVKYHRQFLSFPDQIELDSSVKEFKSLKDHIKHLRERIEYEGKVIKRLIQKTAGKTQPPVYNGTNEDECEAWANRY